MLRRVAGVRRPLGVEQDADQFLAEVEGAHHGRRHRLLELHGRRHRRPGLRQAQGGDHPGQAQRAPRRASPAARSTTRSATSCGPTVVESSDPTDQMFSTEYFGPILAVHVYEDRDFEKVVAQMESFAPYALTGAIIAQDRAAIAWARKELRFAAGNFYINDKPTGAVVGQQPFGGGRASGTNDKAGAAVNLLRWTSPRSHQGDVRPAEGLPLPVHGLTSSSDEPRNEPADDEGPAGDPAGPSSSISVSRSGQRVRGTGSRCSPRRRRRRTCRGFGSLSSAPVSQRRGQVRVGQERAGRPPPRPRGPRRGSPGRSRGW